MKKEEIERINKIADKLSIEFKVSDEDSANPAVNQYKGFDLCRP